MDRLERLEAIEEIRNLKARYYRLMDTKQWDELKSVFTADMKVLTPDGKVYAEGGETYAAGLRNSLEKAVSCHQGLSGEIEIVDDGNARAVVSIERQDLDEILGNLIENAAKYGGGSVFATVRPLVGQGQVSIEVEDDGAGIPAAERARIFDRGVRLDTGKPGTGLGLAIVRDVAEIYGGSVELGDSEDLGGLLVRLTLPAG